MRADKESYIKPNQESRKLSSLTKLTIALVLLLIIVGSGLCTYRYEHNKLNKLQAKVIAENTELTTINSKLALANSASEIPTNGWTASCDPRSSFCFKYPSGWKITTDYNGIPQGEATVANPANTINFTYVDGYEHDTGPCTFHLYSIKYLTIGSNSLALIGGYYISSVSYQPMYGFLNASYFTSSNNGSYYDGLPDGIPKPGDDFILADVPLFSYNTATFATDAEIAISSNNQAFSTTQQANAWFNSINGKTAYKIIDSLYLQQ